MKDQKRSVGKEDKKRSGKPERFGEDKNRKFDKNKKFSKERPGTGGSEEKSPSSKPFRHKDRPEKTFTKRPGSRPEKQGEFEEKRPGKRSDYGEKRPARRDDFREKRPEKQGEFEEKRPGKRSDYGEKRPPRRDDYRGKRPERQGEYEDKRPAKRSEYGDKPPAKREDYRENRSEKKSRYEEKRPASRPEYGSKRPSERKPESRNDYGIKHSDTGYGREEEAAESTTLIIKGRHEVLNALEGKEKIETVYISSSVKGPVPAKLRELASAAGVPVKELNAENFERKFGEKSQGIAAVAGAFAYSELNAIIDRALAGNQVLVALNQVEDARNLGAIVRTVEASGCSGVIIPKHRAAGMTEWAVRTAQGAAAHLPVARVTNLGDAIKTLQEKGFWVIGLDETAEKNFTEIVYNGPILLVAGGEDAGLGDRVKKSCDQLVSIPLRGKTTSLNVSVSTAVVLYEICRQKDFFSKT